MNLLSIADLGDELRGIVELGLQVKRDPNPYRTALSGRSIGLFFQKQSLRTWVSCDVAAIQLGIHPIVIRNEQTGLGTRETPEDVSRVLERYLDLLGLRVFDHGDLEAMAAATTIPIVNLLSDLEHPCQAIADMMTVAEKGPIAGATIAYVGDGNNVCNSLVLASAHLGASIRVATPTGYEPPQAVVDAARSVGEVMITNEPEEAVSDADVVYTDVWTSMGQEAEAGERHDLFTSFQVDSALFGLAHRDAIFMHCLPAHRGEEVSSEVMDSPRSRVFDQAENRLHSFKAILLTLLG